MEMEFEPLASSQEVKLNVQGTQLEEGLMMVNIKIKNKEKFRILERKKKKTKWDLFINKSL